VEDPYIRNLESISAKNEKIFLPGVVLPTHLYPHWPHWPPTRTPTLGGFLCFFLA
jgi:hypothetical protein